MNLKSKLPLTFAQYNPWNIGIGVDANRQRHEAATGMPA